MKKIAIILIALFLFGACKDTLEQEFKDPSVYTPTKDQLAPGLFTSALTQWKFYIKDYGEWWWQLGGNGVFQYGQIATRYITPRYSWYVDYADVQNGNGFDQSGFNWFNDYYLRIRNWGLIRDALEDLEGQEYNDSYIYFQLTSVIKDWGALRNVDLYNSIPYTESLKGTQGVFFVPYDDPKELYVTVLNDLKRISEELPQNYASLSPKAKATLEIQDLALQGDMDKWVQYINALRLRYAVKLAGVDEATAKSHIAEVIQNLPQMDLKWTIPHVQAADALPGGGTWQRGIFERAFAAHVPNVIMNRMNFHNMEYEEGIDDPRLPVLAMPTKHNDYRGVSMNADGQEADYNAGETYYPYADNIEASSTDNAKSMWSHITFTHNDMPADMYTLAEIDLLLAEVAMKSLGSTSKTAGDHIRDAIVHSTDFWYEMNALSEYGMELSEPWLSLTHPTKPDQSVIDGYADMVKAAFDSKTDLEDQMEMMMQQKYIHINLLRPYMLWGELRRTRHPKIEKMTFGGVVMAPMVERMQYPNSEFETNTDNYLEVVDQNNWTTPIFWVTNPVSYYRDDYIPFDTSDAPTFE